MHLGRHLSRSVDSVGLCPNIPILKTPQIVCSYECGMEYKGLMRVCHTSKSVQAPTHVMSLIISDNWNIGQWLHVSFHTTMSLYILSSRICLHSCTTSWTAWDFQVPLLFMLVNIVFSSCQDLTYVYHRISSHYQHEIHWLVLDHCDLQITICD